MKQKSADHHRRWMLRFFEWGVIACIIGLLSGLLIDRFGRAQAAIEQQNFLATVRTLQAAVLLQSVMRPREAAPGGNPVTIYRSQFGRFPVGYLGELKRPDPADVAGGSWYFDSGMKRLVYRVNNARFFKSGLGGPPRKHLQLVGQEASTRLTVRIMDSGRWVVGDEPSMK